MKTLKTLQLLIILAIFAFSACEGAFEVHGEPGTSVAQRGLAASVDDSKADNLAQNEDETDEIEEDPEVIAKALYEDNCGACHGDDGLGAQAWPLSIQQFDPIAPIIKEGQGTMSAIPSLDDAQIQAIQNHLISLRTY